MQLLIFVRFGENLKSVDDRGTFSMCENVCNKILFWRHVCMQTCACCDFADVFVVICPCRECYQTFYKEENVGGN